MDDTISRQAAIEEIHEYWRSLTLRRKRIPLAAEAVYMDLKGVVAILPSAQPEIVRCKDCKWSVEHYDTDGNVPYWVCKNWDSGTDADGFCHEAERRTDEQLGKGESDD